VCFFGSYDSHLLRNGSAISSSQFPLIGTEYCELDLEEYISYDEMQLSALLGVSTPTFFINRGTRNNAGLPHSTHVMSFSNPSITHHTHLKKKMKKEKKRKENQTYTQTKHKIKQVNLKQKDINKQECM
jgi:hypothetical protein